MIYLLSADDALRAGVSAALSQQGYQTQDFALPSAFWRALEQQRPELLLLGLSLPEEDGISLLRRLRALPPLRRLPIVMLAVSSSEYDRVLALDSGADDFIPQSCGTLELVARVRAVLRRAAPLSESGAPVQVGPITILTAQRAVQVSGKSVTLTNKEYALLCLLAENQGIVLTREALMDKIWGLDCERENRTLDVHIRALRVKLGQAGALIKTVRGVGYTIA